MIPLLAMVLRIQRYARSSNLRPRSLTRTICIVVCRLARCTPIVVSILLSAYTSLPRVVLSVHARMSSIALLSHLISAWITPSTGPVRLDGEPEHFVLSCLYDCGDWTPHSLLVNLHTPRASAYFVPDLPPPRVQTRPQRPAYLRSPSVLTQLASPNAHPPSLSCSPGTLL